jgi:hypothetical protein
LGDFRIEVAGEGVSDDAILDAVGCVAGIKGSLMEDGELFVRQRTGWCEVGGLFDPDGTGEEMLPVIGGGTGDDAVEVVGVSRGFHGARDGREGQSDSSPPSTASLRSAPTGMAAPPEASRASRAIAEVDNLFRMA